MFFYEEYTLFENLMMLLALYAGPLFVYFIFKPLLLRFMERKSGPAQEGADGPDHIYWNDDE